jgi:hypothetical protein
LDTSNWFTPAQAARSLCISVEYTRKLMKSGRLDHTMTPLGRIISPEALEAARAKGYGTLRRSLAVRV